MAMALYRKFKILRHDLKSLSKGISKLSIAIENSNRAIFELDELKINISLPLLKLIFGEFSSVIFCGFLHTKNNMGENIAPFAGLNLVMSNLNFFKLWRLKDTEEITFPNLAD